MKVSLLLLLIGIVFVAVISFIYYKSTQQPATLQVSLTGQIKEFEITAKKFTFEPDTIIVNKGDRVKLKITSVDVAHGFAINEFDVNERLEPEKTVNIEFVADKFGNFTFYCSVYCGDEHSKMRGQLVVR